MSSKRESDLKGADRSTVVFEFLLTALAPHVLFVHGRSAVEYFERIVTRLTYGPVCSYSLSRLHIDVFRGIICPINVLCRS